MNSTSCDGTNQCDIFGSLWNGLKYKTLNISRMEHEFSTNEKNSNCFSKAIFLNVHFSADITFKMRSIFLLCPFS